MAVTNRPTAAERATGKWIVEARYRDGKEIVWRTTTWRDARHMCSMQQAADPWTQFTYRKEA